MALQKNVLFFCLFFLVSIKFLAQVGIGTTTPHGSSVLDVSSSNSGVLIPRVALQSTLDTSTIINPETSLLVYNQQSMADVHPGFYFWNGSRWSRINDQDNESSQLIYGEIYRISPEERFYNYLPIEFGANGPQQNITADSNSFLVPVSGTYRVSYAISIVMRGANNSPVTLGFFLSTGLAPPLNPPNPPSGPAISDRIPGSYCHTRVTPLGNSSCSMTKIVHLQANQRVYLFSDSNFSIVRILPHTALMNIELIKAD
ncbi:MAG TPA: hypothetical protein VKY34_04360 [Xanthomarina sp.]|nr:hypothetical protein [Xanthomarina sp.]